MGADTGYPGAFLTVHGTGTVDTNITRKTRGAGRTGARKQRTRNRGTLYHFYNEGTEQNRVQLGVKYRKNHFFSSMQLSQKSFSDFRHYDLAAPRAAV